MEERQMLIEIAAKLKEAESQSMLTPGSTYDIASASQEVISSHEGIRRESAGQV